MNKKQDEEASLKIHSYLKTQNRPYSVNDIFLNLHKEFGKTAVQKSLDMLVENGSVKEKTYGKQKVFVVNQDEFPPLDEKKLLELDQRINELAEELKTKTKELMDLEMKLKNMGSTLTTEEAHNEISQIEKDISSLEASLAKVQSSGVVVSQQEKERAQFEREKKVKEWKKRKRMALDILDAILEGYPKSKKELYEDIGIETDQDAGIDLSQFV